MWESVVWLSEQLMHVRDYAHPKYLWKDRSISKYEGNKGPNTNMIIHL